MFHRMTLVLLPLALCACSTMPQRPRARARRPVTSRSLRRRKNQRRGPPKRLALIDLASLIKSSTI